MTGETKKTSQLAASVLIFVNFFVILFSVLLFALSLWVISSQSTLSATIRAVGSTTLSALLPPESLTIQSGVGAALLATFMFSMAFLGLYGAACRSQFLLFMYSTLVLMILLLECALTYYFTSNLIEKGLCEEDGQWTHYIRLGLGCCDYNSTKPKEISKPPWSCCGVTYFPNNCTVLHASPKDCQTEIASWVDRYVIGIYTSLALVHVVLSSLSLLIRSRSSSRFHS